MSKEGEKMSGNFLPLYVVREGKIHYKSMRYCYIVWQRHGEKMSGLVFLRFALEDGLYLIGE